MTNNDRALEGIRAMVREEIALALKAVALAADQADVPYETGELEASALAAVGKVAENTLGNLAHCWRDDHLYETWMGSSSAVCLRCGSDRVNPFETKDQTHGTS